MGFHSPLPHPISGAGSGIQAGFSSALPFFSLGAVGSVQAGYKTPIPGLPIGADGVDQGGYSSLLGFWAGGAGGDFVTQGGYYSMLGHWVGGAAEGEIIIPPDGGGGVDPSGGDGGTQGKKKPKKKPKKKLKDKLKKKIKKTEKVSHETKTVEFRVPGVGSKPIRVKPSRFIRPEIRLRDIDDPVDRELALLLREKEIEEIRAEFIQDVVEFDKAKDRNLAALLVLLLECDD